ncbi:MAG: deoxynucleoside kinase [Candidatus Pacebacteria bacterium]|nr:deoxynucleoside kinase [Candidatus Paceibacterota bacterium]MCD8508378.1 deoxynucleoside kinase [Candidatus Paceibacterota bacterium]MCD8527769.1 deoxynucleoside kinase [Candidatus Paceibacterota bacterium]MCD8563691.1 deoxynucleoside kinase [Candidatus Paceibacterota bacterium]
MQGKLIVIDGTDGSGKATQVAHLKERLVAEGYQVASLDFPRYEDNFFGSFIGECLRGDHGDWAGLSPRIASVVYAADRFESAETIRAWLAEGRVVILDRYVSSNQIHQGGKITETHERKAFLTWLDTMEHDIFKIPRPDIIIYLDVPLAVSQALLSQKNTQDTKTYLAGKKDQHENDLEHLTAAKEAGLALIAEMNNWHRINCAPEGELLSIEEVHEMVYGVLSEGGYLVS